MAFDHPTEQGEKLLVRQVVGDFLRTEAPGHLPEFERSFEIFYGQAEQDLQELRHEDVHGDWRLPFDASFGSGLAVGTVIGVAAFLVREALSVADDRRRKRHLEKLKPQLWRQTGSHELVLALCALVLDLVERTPANPTPAPDLELQVRLTSVNGGTALTYVLHSVPAGLHIGIEDASPRSSRYNDVEALLEKGGCDLLHFIGHGDFSPERANEAKIVLEDRAFRARHLIGAIQTRIKKDRPLVFLNACRVARQGWSLTSLGGWVEAWVRTCECGAFVGPQWVVKDSLAYEFAQVFYQELEQGRTLGEAAQAARQEVKRKDPGRPTWLAFAVYGHPGAQVTLGGEATSPVVDRPTQPEVASPVRSGQPATTPVSSNAIPGREIFGGNRFSNEGAPIAAASHLPLPPPSFLGRADDLRFLKAGLCRSGGEGAERGPLLLVTGWPGVGKTTLTTALANDPELRAAFPDGILWTALDQSPSLLTEISSWCIALGSPGPSPVATTEEASLHLGHLLRRRRVLLLLDDVWEAAHAVPFLVGGPGCAMLATSRLDAVAEQLAPTSGAVYRLPLLSEDAGLELLRSRAPEVVAVYAEECRVLVRELEGLPLSLHVAGRMLAQECRLWSPSELLQTLRAGRQLLEQSAPSDRTDLRSQTLPTLSVLLSKSTERLSAELFERFAFLGVFAPKPATFDLAALQAVWDVEDPKPSVRALVDLGLLEAVGEGNFRMHALLVAHARSLLEE